MTQAIEAVGCMPELLKMTGATIALGSEKDLKGGRRKAWLCGQLLGSYSVDQQRTYYRN
jgi:hypothetical protein